MKYLELLKHQGEEKQLQIEDILRKYSVQPVGTGYIDLITLNDNIEGLINSLSDIHTLVVGVTWWCHCTEETKSRLGCPHGFGGPKSRFYEGIFFEAHLQMFEISRKEIAEIEVENMNTLIPEINKRILRYIQLDFIKEEDFIECFVPGIWLSVPKDWNRIKYYINNSYTSD